MSSSIAAEHVLRVRALYKALLRLHRGLPLQMQALGNQYMKDEFKRHKEANAAEVEVFMVEWTVSIFSKTYIILMASNSCHQT